MKIQNLQRDLSKKIELSTEFVKSLHQGDYEFLPLHVGATEAGKSLKLGFSWHPRWPV